MRLGFLQELVISPQGRTAVTADKTGGLVAGDRVALALQHGQPNQGVYAAHESVAVILGVFVVQGKSGQRCVHAMTPG